MGLIPFLSPISIVQQISDKKSETMSDGVKIQKKRTFKKYTFRGVDLDQLLDMKSENLIELLGCRQRRHFNRGIKRREENFLERLRKAKKAMTGEVGEKPAMVNHYIGEFSMTYKPVRHGRPGIGATHSSRFIPLKQTVLSVYSACKNKS